jgi:hypothetical protein
MIALRALEAGDDIGWFDVRHPSAGIQGRRRARHLRRLAQHDPGVRYAHRRARVDLFTYLAGGDLPTLITAPLVYSLLVPMAVVDGWVTLYQALCFRAWGLPRVRRRPYFIFDRQHLAYLNGLERVNCVFCGYANGVIAYVREVAARTEQYWCPIRHGRRVRDPHARYVQFVDYGDAEAYRRELPALRHALATPHGVPAHARRTAS